MMNVRYLLSAQPIGGLPLVHDGEKKIYQNPAAMPRAWLVGKARRMEGEDAAYKWERRMGASR
jgi:hypothetical protein